MNADAIRRAAALTTVLVVAAAAYTPALDGEFTFDDFAVVSNPAVRAPAALARALPAAVAGQGRILTDLTYAADVARAGFDPRAFHETGIAIHLLMVLALFALAREILRRAGLGRPSLALAGAALFAVHPLHSEAVAYVAQRSEALSSLFTALAILGWLRADQEDRRGRIVGWASAGTIAFASGLAAKGVSITAPALFLLVVGVLPSRDGPRRWRRPALVVAPAVALAAVFAVGLLRALRGGLDAGFAVQHLTPRSYWLSQGRVVLHYLRLMLWPAGQSVDLGLQPSQSLSDPGTLPSLVGLLTMVTVAVSLVTRRSGPSRLVGVGVAWFLVALAPTSLLPIADLVAEHRTYLASFGLILSAVVIVDAVLAQVPIRLRTAAAALLLVAIASTLAAALVARARLWGNSAALWADARDQSPRNARAHANHGSALVDRGFLAEAVPSYRASLRIGFEVPEYQRIAVTELAALLVDLGRTPDARAVLTSEIAGDEDARLLAALARVRVAEGDAQAGEILARRAVELDPESDLAHLSLGIALERAGQPADAVPELARAVELAPYGIPPRLRLSRALSAAGRWPEACAAADAASRVGSLPLRDETRATLRELGCISPAVSPARAAARTADRSGE